uniref:Peptidase S1 domain-containing protein n=1 Tax=Anopheles farauti TaxID=69004 RepID=A0A182QTR8_9DIPT
MSRQRKHYQLRSVGRSVGRSFGGEVNEDTILAGRERAAGWTVDGPEPTVLSWVSSNRTTFNARRQQSRPMVTMKTLASLLVCLVAASLGGSATGEQPDDVSNTTSIFPVFFRSRFNPRVQLTNESLLIPDDAELLLPRSNASATMEVRNITESSTQASPVEVSTAAPPDAGDECGVIDPDVDTFPWIAVLEHEGPQTGAGRKRTLSKGVLIDRHHVLTTVSSVHNSHPSWVVTGVRLGDAPTRRHSNGRRTVHRFPIETVYLHESKDIAVIRLADGGVRNVTDYIRPICLPQDDHRLESFKLSAHVCQRKSDSRSSTAREGGRVSRSRLQPLELISGDACNTLLRPYGARLPVKNFCARDVSGDNCTGALGGPAVATIRGRYHVLGLRSYIQTETVVESLDVPSIYVRVGGLRKWMSAVIKADTVSCCPSTPPSPN